MQITKTFGAKRASFSSFLTKAQAELLDMAMLTVGAIAVCWGTSVILADQWPAQMLAKLSIIVAYTTVAGKLGWRIAAHSVLYKYAFWVETLTVILVASVAYIVLGL